MCVPSKGRKEREGRTWEHEGRERKGRGTNTLQEQLLTPLFLTFSPPLSHLRQCCRRRCRRLSLRLPAPRLRLRPLPCLLQLPEPGGGLRACSLRRSPALMQLLLLLLPVAATRDPEVAGGDQIIFVYGVLNGQREGGDTEGVGGVQNEKGRADERA
jgi:hypothetical protein